MIAPRRARLYIARTAYVAVLLLLVFTAWLVLYGTQQVQDIGDLARFGTILFQILAPLQLAWATFFSAMLAAAAVAHEKDRRTLILLLLTNLTNSELVLGKLLASILNVLVMLAAAAPLFIAITLLGGVSFRQIGWAFAVTVASVLVFGSLGSLLALWREKTFQALALTVLALVFWVAGCEILAAGAFGDTIAGIPCRVWATGLSPWRAIFAAIQPYDRTEPTLGVLGTSIHLYLLSSAVIAILINGFAVVMVRVWNPSRETMPQAPDEESQRQKSIFGIENEHVPGANVAQTSAEKIALPARTRTVWDNPIIWREIRTWAYGGKILVVRLAYLSLFALAVASLYWMTQQGQIAAASHLAMALAPVFFTESDIGQCSSCHIAYERTRRQGLGSAFGYRSDAQGNRLRQTGRRVLQYQGNDRAAALALRLFVDEPRTRPGKYDLLGARLDSALYFRGGPGHSRRHQLFKLGQRYCREFGHCVFPLGGRCGLHENHACLQRFLPGPIRAVLCLYGPGRRGVVCGAGVEKSFHGHRRGVVPLSIRHLLCHYKLSARRNNGSFHRDGRRLWFYYGSYARSGDL